MEIKPVEITPVGNKTVEIKPVESKHAESKPSSTSYHPLDASRLIPQLYKPFLHPIDAETFIGLDDVEYKLTNPPRFTKPLGKNVLVLDVDTRALTEEGGLMQDKLDYGDLTPRTAGMMGHYLYGQCFPLITIVF